MLEHYRGNKKLFWKEAFRVKKMKTMMVWRQNERCKWKNSGEREESANEIDKRYQAHFIKRATF